MNQKHSPDIRRAEPADAPGINRIIRAAWSEYNPDVSADVISTHTTLVVSADEKLVGFVDCFSTMRDEQGDQDKNDVLRWEVDWLAVDPAYHGNGFGKALVRAARDAGRVAGAQVARALIRVDNTASEKVFEKNGFKPLPDVLALYTSNLPLKDLRSVADHRNSYLIPVKRLNDSALWIEGEVSDRVLQQARHVIGIRGWHVAGVLIPRSDRKSMKLAEAENYTHVNNYRQYIYQYA